jgi:hypothetical protein
MEYLIHLNAPTIQVAAFFVHEAIAPFADANAQAHNRVPVDAGDTLNAAVLLPSASMETASVFFSFFNSFAIMVKMYIIL